MACGVRGGGCDLCSLILLGVRLLLGARRVARAPELPAPHRSVDPRRLLQPAVLSEERVKDNTERVYRAGSWFNHVRFARVAFCSALIPFRRAKLLGFRFSRRWM